MMSFKNLDRDKTKQDEELIFNLLKRNLSFKKDHDP